MQIGKHRGIVVASEFGCSKNGNEFIMLLFKLTDPVVIEQGFEFGGDAGQLLQFDGFLNDKGGHDLLAKKTIYTLRALGWNGSDIAELDSLDAERCGELLPNEADIYVQSFTTKDGTIKYKIESVGAPSGILIDALKPPVVRALADRLAHLTKFDGEKTTESESDGEKTAAASSDAADEFPVNAPGSSTAAPDTFPF